MVLLIDLFSSFALIEASGANPDILQKEIGGNHNSKTQKSEFSFSLCIEETFLLLLYNEVIWEEENVYVGKYQEMHLKRYSHVTVGVERIQEPGRMSKQGQRDYMPLSLSHSRLETVHSRFQTLPDQLRLLCRGACFVGS